MCNTLTTLETLASRLVCPVPGLHPPTVRNLNLVLGWHLSLSEEPGSVATAFQAVISEHLRPQLSPVFNTITSLVMGISTWRMAHLVRDLLSLPMPQLETLAIWQEGFNGQRWVNTDKVAMINQSILARSAGKLRHVALSVLSLCGDMIPAFYKVTHLLIAENLLLPLGENHTSRISALKVLFPMLMHFKSAEELVDNDIDQWKCQL